MELEESASAAIYRKLSWRIMPFIFAGFLFGYLDRINIAYAKLQMASDLNFSETVYGFGAGVFFVGYILFQFPSNLLLYRFGARRFLSLALLASGITSACTLFVRTPSEYYLIRFALGIAEAGIFPGIILYLTHWFPNERRARSIAILYTALAASGLVGGPISGWIMEQTQGSNTFRGWQWIYLLEGLPTVLLGLTASVFLSNGVQEASWLTASEKNILERKLELSRPKEKHNSSLEVLKDGRIWCLAFIYFNLCLGGYFIIFYLPTLIKEVGILSFLNIGLLSAIPYGCAIFTMHLFSYKSDRKSERSKYINASLMLSLAGLLGLIRTGSGIAVLIFCLSLAMAGILTALSLFWSLPNSILSRTNAALGVAIINSIGSIGGFIAPYGFGYLRGLSQGSPLPTAISAFLLFVSSLAITFLSNLRSSCDKGADRSLMSS